MRERRTSSLQCNAYAYSGPNVYEMMSSEVSICKLCHEIIYDRFVIRVGADTFHSACVNCSRCSVSLSSNNTCYDKKGGLYCNNCYIRIFSNIRCYGCNHSIANSEYVMKTRDSYYHVACFCCSVCKVVLRCGQKYGVRDNALFCESHYHTGSVYTQDTSISTQALTNPAVVPNQMYERPISSTYSTYGKDFIEKPPLMYKSEAMTDPRIFSNGHFNNETPFSKIEMPFKLDTPFTMGQQEYKMSGMEMDTPYSPSTSDEDGPFKIKGKRRMSAKEKRHRTTFTPEQVQHMKEAFKTDRNPDSAALQTLSERVNLSKRVLQVWFQNARAKYKKCGPEDVNENNNSEESYQESVECESGSV